MINEMYVEKQCQREDIAIGEVFTFNGCWTIMVKTAKNKAFVLASDDIGTQNCEDSWGDRLAGVGDNFVKGTYFKHDKKWKAFGVTGVLEERLFKLPKHIQMHWAEYDYEVLE